MFRLFLAQSSFVCFFIIGLFTINPSCSKVDSENEIVDPNGIRLELSWTNAAVDPTIGTDLKLYIRDGFNTVAFSTYSNKIEFLEIEPGFLNNGTYSVEVYVNDIDRVTNYTITAKGVTTDKTFSRDFGPINGNDLGTLLKPFSLVISGDSFTLN